jgi:hypothetical protein
MVADGATIAHSSVDYSVSKLYVAIVPSRSQHTLGPDRSLLSNRGLTETAFSTYSGVGEQEQTEDAAADFL